MNATYLIDKNLKTVFLTIAGEVELFDIISPVKKMLEDPMYKPGLNNFTDLSDARPSITVNIKTIKESVNFLKSVETLIGKCKWAVFTPEDYTYTIALIFGKLFQSDAIDMQVFKDRDKAHKWLEI